ncbi:hypothetical protein NUW58_g1677 [Xylaria curta]|uniref:Uncharacterized protein n=1 Tax=Xylaria curta TaxID=42375 RepID=A0ACC1PJ80_9PEZI|nr:hypothetical protein NUW58_g1677 [Xylaria curta]
MPPSPCPWARWRTLANFSTHRSLHTATATATTNYYAGIRICHYWLVSTTHRHVWLVRAYVTGPVEMRDEEEESQHYNSGSIATFVGMPNLDEYTIGWLCAVGKESVAAQVFLDEEHEKPDSLPAKDDNSYTLGRVGKHNVVIAALPRGEYGLVNAANAAKDMIRSFPNLRAGLMVGIGGGAPARHDIRLGDVVVSSAGSGNGGVYQFDFGKTIQNEAFVSTGFLNKPPTFIMTAVSTLETTYSIKGHQLKEAVASVLDRNPRLRKVYQRPSASTDRLYKANILHSPRGNCVLYCGGDASSLILREARSADEDDPAIHYGLIASSNQVMRNAPIRDKLSMDKDVLCFEMEAAGLMNQFPFLIVRGICDYSDTHKNDLWQGYAAMIAAAYTKDLLHNITPNRVEIERPLVGILSDVSARLSSIDEAVAHTKRYLIGGEDTQILDWLTSADYGTQQTDYLRRRQPGTGQWLLDSDQYQTWREGPKKTLFCPGIPGAGKTILTSIVVDDLENYFCSESTTAVAYVYCNYKRRGEQTVESLLCSLLKQLAHCQPSLPHSVTKLYKRHKRKGTQPSFDEISEALESVALQNSRVFIIVDALDECQASDGCRAKFLAAIFNLQKKTGVNIFATSRMVSEVTKQFEASPSIEIRATEGDIRRYLEGHLSQLSNCVRNRPDLQNEIIRGITKAVDGMFLLAQLHFASLEGKDTPKAIQTALRELKTGSDAYDAAYETSMARIQGQIRERVERAKQVLSWITCARRPLTKLELQHALAVEAHKPALDEDNIPQIEDIVSVCAGLVTVDDDSNIIRLVHYTTHEYFRRTQSCWFPDAQSSILTTCIAYLSFHEFANGYAKTDREFEERLESHLFYDYAARNWGYHSYGVSDSQDIVSFFRKPAQVEASSQVLMTGPRDGMRGYSQWAPKQVTGLHLAVLFGLSEVVATLPKDLEVDAEDSHGRTPLSWAAENGHEAIVKLLLDKEGVDPDSKDEDGQTPLAWARLLWAVERGHEAVVKLLLKTEGVDPDSEASDGMTPLSLAEVNGHAAIVKLLLETEGVADLKYTYLLHVKKLDLKMKTGGCCFRGSYGCKEAIEISKRVVAVWKKRSGSTTTLD